MDLNLLSGLLLTAMVLFIVGYVVKALCGESVARFFAEYSAKAATDPNEILIGAVGRVVDAGNGDMTVRIGIERWRAELDTADARSLPLGTAVKVTGVRGLVLQVEESLPAR